MLVSIRFEPKTCSTIANQTALRRAVRSGRVAIAETARRVHGNPTQFPRPRRLPHLRSSAEPGKKQGQVAEPLRF